MNISTKTANTSSFDYMGFSIPFTKQTVSLHGESSSVVNLSLPTKTESDDVFISGIKKLFSNTSYLCMQFID